MGDELSQLIFSSSGQPHFRRSSGGQGSGVAFFLAIIAGVTGYFIGVTQTGLVQSIIWIITSLAALSILFGLKIANQWQKAVVLRLGQYRGLNGPGLFWIVPILDSISHWVDLRTITTDFRAEKTLTKDSVPVDVDAILFWQVVEPQKAALEVADYQAAISLSAQTALRDVIGKTELADMLAGREKLDNELQKMLGDKTATWGIKVMSVEIRDVLIPSSLQDAMSCQAQAERERQARVILGESEKQIAASFTEAAQTYAGSPEALHLRAMNMLFEGLKERGSIIIVPSSAVDSMNLGGMMGIAAVAKDKLKTKN